MDIGKTLETDDHITNKTTDEELECHTDTAMLACQAYTGGSWTPTNADKWYYDKQQDRWITQDDGWYFEDYGVWNRNTREAKVRRQEFWKWWLTQTIGEAWLQAQ